MTGFLLIGLISATAAHAEPTEVVIRARAQDAKFIGSHVGGVDVVLANADTGAELAHGRIEGGTGDTKMLMTTPAARGQHLADADTAKFVAHLDLSEPTRVRLTARGPAGMEASSTQWVLPGRSIDGDGWVLTFPGLIVEPSIAVDADHRVELRSKVSLLCGCPIEPGGLWDAAHYRITAEVRGADGAPMRIDLAYAGRRSEFGARLPAPLKPGAYRMRVIAADAATSNVGVADASFTVK